MSFKKLLCMVVALAMGCSLLACGEEEEVEVVSEPIVVEEPKELEIIKTEVVYTYFDSNYDSWLKQCETDYESKHEDIDIVLKFVDSATLSNRISKLCNGEQIDIGDIVEISYENVPSVLNSNIAVNLDSFFSDSSLNVDDYLPAVSDYFSKDESLVGLPLSYETVGLWYNKALFDEKGVGYPNSDWNWMTLVDAAGSLTDEVNGKYGIVAALDDLLPLYVTVNEMGGFIYSEDGAPGGFESDLTKAGVRCFVDLLEAGYSPSMDSIHEEDALSQLLSGKVAMIYAGNSCLAKIKANGSLNDIGCTYVPTLGGTRTVPVRVKGNCILAYSTHQKEAWDFLEYLTTDNTSIENYASCETLIPANYYAFDKFLNTYAETSLHFEAFSSQVGDCSFPVYPNDNDALVLEKLASVFDLKNSVDEAANEICSN